MKKRNSGLLASLYLSLLSDTIIVLVAKVKPLEERKLKMRSVCEEEGSRVA